MVTLAGLDPRSLVAGPDVASRFVQSALTPFLTRGAAAGDQSAVARLSGFNPQALQNILSAQSQQAGIQSQQAANQAEQIKQQVTAERTKAIRRKGRLEKLIKADDATFRNTINQLVIEGREDDDFVIEDFAQIASDFTKNPQAARLRLQSALEGADAEIQIADQLLGRVVKPQPGFTLKAGETRFGPAGEVVAAIPEVTTRQTPEALVAGLPENVQAQAIEAFNLAGGGDKGVKALQKAIETGRAQVRREEIPQALAASFPNASPAELRQLEATALAGKTPESGLKAAEKVRSEQRRLKKAQSFQERAVSLLDRILTNPELDDVIGSFEGRIDFLSATSDAESEAIADIDEAQDILTSDNMDLMTGVLSESDIQILKNLSSGALKRTRGEARFRKDVTTLRDKLSSQLVQTIDDTSKERLVFDPVTGQLAPQ